MSTNVANFTPAKDRLTIALAPHKQRHACNVIFPLAWLLRALAMAFVAYFRFHRIFTAQQGAMRGNVLTRDGLVTIPSLDPVVWTSQVTRDKLCLRLLLDVGVDVSVVYLISQMGILPFSHMLFFALSITVKSIVELLLM